jgi:hypothetical protein
MLYEYADISPHAGGDMRLFLVTLEKEHPVWDAFLGDRSSGQQCNFYYL